MGVAGGARDIARLIARSAIVLTNVTIKSPERLSFASWGNEQQLSSPVTPC